MRTRLGTLLALVVSIALPVAQATASTTASTSAKTNGVATSTNLFKAPPVPTPDSPTDSTFQVNDSKGLLLTCIAPQINTDIDTDTFKNCVLAPGRSLEDVMHTFIQAIHYEQQQQVKERAEWDKERQEKLAQAAAQK